MPPLPPITVVMTVFIPPTEGGFARLQGARQTALSWGRHMRYSGQLRLHVADDSVATSEAETEMIMQFSPWEAEATHTRGKGLGGGLNEGLRAAFSHGDLALYADDSYSLIADLDLTPWARVLLEHEDIGAVSLMPPRPEQKGGQVVYVHGIHLEGVAGVVFGRQGYNWNGRPLLYHRRFFDYYGATLEHSSGYEWEADYANRYNSMPEGPCVLFAFLDPFQHVWSGVRLGDKPPGWSG